ncbi:Uncharacterised protein [Legionella pneumophila]|nr:hypothetical protein ULM_14040 [Legionella pneumophila]CZG25954.1 Uncharacterised protein [Legionella pneumophila]CZG39683.1 Uncharacterised protein [Legionella pneumophila]CZG39709.1 Uncharacterised protein [Legionella pneumophila]CZG47923.1 Uncharacterised protein [Legionella pneumophila]
MNLMISISIVNDQIILKYIGWWRMKPQQELHFPETKSTHSW